MKTLLTTLLLILVFQYCIGQDKITTKNDQQLNVRVIEQTHKVVKYKMMDYDDGPILYINTNRISRIDYKNGFTDLLGNQNPRKEKPFGISAGGAFAPIGRSGFFSASVDYFIIPQVDLEISFGTSDPTSYGIVFSAGSRFHLNSNNSEKGLTPFTGLLVGSNYGDGFLQIPAGIDWIHVSGLHASLSFNEMIGFNSWLVTFIEFRVGWRFNYNSFSFLD